jgi:hypothetical protein
VQVITGGLTTVEIKAPQSLNIHSQPITTPAINRRPETIGRIEILAVILPLTVTEQPLSGPARHLAQADTEGGLTATVARGTAVDQEEDPGDGSEGRGGGQGEGQSEAPAGPEPREQS